MQENNEKTSTKNENSSKKQNTNVKDKKNGQSFFTSCKNEFKKITWPTRKILVKQTITVITISFVVGAIIFVYDLGIEFLFDSLTKLIA